MFAVEILHGEIRTSAKAQEFNVSPYTGDWRLLFCFRH